MTEIPTPTETFASSAEKRRPTGITVLAILMILGGLLNLASAPGSIYLYGPLYTGYSAVSGIITLIIGIALWQMLPWARKAAIFWEIISIIVGVVIAQLLASIFGSLILIAMIPSLIIGIIIISYLMQGSTKAAFEGTTDTW